jgi:methyl-accepting chemotaxis protein
MDILGSELQIIRRSDMFNDMKIGTKIAGGFGIVIVIAAVLGFLGWNSLGRVEKLVVTANDAGYAVNELQNARGQEKDFIIMGFDTRQGESKNSVDMFEEYYSVLNSSLTELSGSDVLNSKEKKLADASLAVVDDYKAGFETLVQARKNKDEAFAEWSRIGWDVTSKIDQAFADIIDPEIQRAERGNDIESLNRWTEIGDKLHSDVVERFLLLRVTAVYLIATEADAQWEGYRKQLQKTTEGISSWTTLVRGIPGLENAARDISSYIDQYSKSGDKFYSGIVSQREANAQMLQAANNITRNCNELGDLLKSRMNSVIAQSLTMMIILAVAGVIIGIVLAVFITRGITKPVNRIINNLNDGANQVGSASAQVSAASQSLAEGSSEQASSLEETSSSLEEMSSMTKQNADNANQANMLANRASEAALKGTEAMESMNQAIQEIKQSSDETAKIIKVIDEIAFQTNLLALNAAVEAARAGEAGKGFAVVAEEVRNLAMRSAEAAKNTNALIEGSQKNADNGVRATDEFKAILEEIVSSIKKVNDLVGEVSAASNEQAQGISQINTAISQIDQVTQQNASNAEESASASEELSAQAGEMQRIVAELTRIVNGSSRILDVDNQERYKESERDSRTALKGLKSRLDGSHREKMTINRDAHPLAGNTALSGKAKETEAIPLAETEKEVAEF